MKTGHIAMLLLAAVACDGPAGAPVAPNPASSAAGLSADASTLRVSGGSASGHADVHGTPVQGIQDERYSFTARSTDVFPLAKGQVEVHFRRFTGEEGTVHAEVTCLSVVDNQAWVGSRVTKFVFEGQEEPERLGTPMIFRVLDVGEGKGATDLASLVFFPPAGGDLAHCTTHPNFPILRESGNIQVKPE
jgi:hypothetical protein